MRANEIATEMIHQISPSDHEFLRTMMLANNVRRAHGDSHVKMPAAHHEHVVLELRRIFSSATPSMMGQSVLHVLFGNRKSALSTVIVLVCQY
jgi:hypothetical protein